MKIFLSYTRKKDQFQKVSSFRERLEHEVEMRSPGSRVFQDTEHLLDGSHFPEVLAAELKGADVLLVLVSPAWLQSEWCRREFSLFTDDATDSTRLHRILPVLWVDTPEMNSRSLDLVARTMANISYSDWRDLRYENWDDSKNQRQVGKLAECAIALLRPTPGATPHQTPGPGTQNGSDTGRLSEEKERLLLALNCFTDGLREDQVAQKSSVSQTRANVYLTELQAKGFVRQRLRVGQRMNHWLVSTPGKAYLVQHDLVA
jgi:TIR domain